jgi:hypothetical protein
MSTKLINKTKKEVTISRIYNANTNIKICIQELFESYCNMDYKVCTHILEIYGNGLENFMQMGQTHMQ